MLLVPTASPAPIHAASEVRASEAAAELLLRALAGQAPPALGEKLAKLGPEATPFLLRVLQKGGVPVAAKSESAQVLEIPPELAEVVLDALARSPRDALLRLLLAAAEASDAAEREVALRVLGRIGTREHLEWMGRIASSTGASGTVPARLRAAFQEALGRVLERDSKAFEGLQDLYVHVPPGLVHPLIRAACRDANVRAVELCSALLGVRPEADLLLLTEMARLSEAVSDPIPRQARAKPRLYLLERDIDSLRAAAMLAGVLEDYEALPDLIRLLAHADPRMTQVARRALRRIAHQDLGSRRESWEAWYRAESEWWESNSVPIAEALRGRDAARTAAAVQELVRHRLLRDDAAHLLAEGLQRSERELVLMCCRALGQFRSSVAVTALEALRGHPDEDIRGAAETALALIVGPRRGPSALRTALEVH